MVFGLSEIINYAAIYWSQSFLANKKNCILGFLKGVFQGFIKNHLTDNHIIRQKSKAPQK